MSSSGPGPATIRCVTRDPKPLARTSFDLLIVGAGIYGLTIACDAAQRGLSVAVIDRGDFGSGTSFNSAKTVHGGVRSLQRGDVSEMRAYLRERRTLSLIAPHLVHPLRFLMPTYRHPLRSRTALRFYFMLNDLLAHDRNEGLDPSKHFPPSLIVSRDECLRDNPLIDPAGVTGGVAWYDAQMHNSDRVALAFLKSAVACGAGACNYLEATAFGSRVDGLTSVAVRDVLSGDQFDIRARLVINVTGLSARAGTRSASLTPPAPLVPAASKGMNLITRRVGATCAVAGTSGAQVFFLAPWRGLTIAGTSHEPAVGPLPAFTGADVTSLLEDIGRAFPRAGLSRQDVSLVHRGLLPSKPGTSGHVQLLRESVIHEHHGDGWDGVISVVGVRYTTARQTAERVVDLALSTLIRSAQPSRSASTRLPGGDIEDFAIFLRDTCASLTPVLGGQGATRVALSYGTEWTAVQRLLLSDPSLAKPLSATCPVTPGELLVAVRHEMAVRLEDALLRRTEAGSGGHPGAEAVTRAAHIMASELGWTDVQRDEEIERVNRAYLLDDGSSPNGRE